MLSPTRLNLQSESPQLQFNRLPSFAEHQRQIDSIVNRQPSSFAISEYAAPAQEK